MFNSGQNKSFYLKEKTKSSLFDKKNFDGYTSINFYLNFII